LRLALGPDMQGQALMSSKFASISGLHQPRTADDSALNNSAVTTAGSVGRWDLDNPMLWLVGIGAVTLGLVATSTHVRVGGFRASVSAGKGA